jgi:hypothetical protein
MLPVSQDCQFLIAPSVFSNFYLCLRGGGGGGKKNKDPWPKNFKQLFCFFFCRQPSWSVMVVNIVPFSSLVFTGMVCFAYSCT